MLQLRTCQLVQHLLELLIRLFKVVILLKLKRFFLQLLWPARLETSPSVSTSPSEALLRSSRRSTWCVPTTSSAVRSAAGLRVLAGPILLPFLLQLCLRSRRLPQVRWGRARGAESIGVSW